MADVTLPQLGETVTEGTITQWFKSVGETVAEDEPLFEVSTDKVDTAVPSPVSGTVTEILAEEGDTVEVGAVIARGGDGDAAPAPAADDGAAGGHSEKTQEPDRGARGGRAPGKSSCHRGRPGSFCHQELLLALEPDVERVARVSVEWLEWQLGGHGVTRARRGHLAGA